MRGALQIGDLISIPIGVQRQVVGQIADKAMAAWFVIVYEWVSAEGAEIDSRAITAAPIRLQALTFDALIRAGHWKVVGHAAVPIERIRWPLFKTMTAFSPDQHSVLNHRGEHVPPPAGVNRRTLPNMTFDSPIRLERAAQALFSGRPLPVGCEGMLVMEDGDSVVSRLRRVLRR